MKNQSEAEWIQQQLDRFHLRYGTNINANWTLARRLLAALRRRGWTPPKPKKGRK